MVVLFMLKVLFIMSFIMAVVVFIGNRLVFGRKGWEWSPIKTFLVYFSVLIVGNLFIPPANFLYYLICFLFWS